jgi:cystathionine gamma-synthase
VVSGPPRDGGGSRQAEPASTSTDAVHAGCPHHRPHHTLAPGIAQTATYTFRDTADLERYMRGQDPDIDREEYGRYGNPTVRELETRVAALEGADDALAFSSGMAAVTSTLFALTKAGDHVVLFSDCYRRTRQFVTQTLVRFGVEHTMVPPGDLGAFEAALRPSTRCVITESPTNPYLHCADLEQIAALVRRHGRIRTLVDSTFATPVNCRPLRFGIDLVIHSATKYLGGHNDVLGGIVAGPQHLMSLVRETRGVLGGVLDPHAAFLIARGLKTLNLRVERQNRTAHAIALELERHPQVRRVFYPGLESHGSHAIAKAQMRGYGGVVSFIVEGGRQAAAKVVDGCRMAKIAASLGGVETLIEQPCLMSFSELSDEELATVGIDPALIRLSVGVEDSNDVLDDVLGALAQLSLHVASTAGG